MWPSVDTRKHARVVGGVESSFHVGRSGLVAEKVREFTVDTSGLGPETRPDVHGQVVKGAVGHTTALRRTASAESGLRVEDDAAGETSGITGFIPVSKRRVSISEET